jgi:integration host factor subunit alpha
MTKAEIIDAVYDRVGGFSKKEAAEVVEAVFDTMKEVLADGQKIKISGFGNFVVRTKKQRIGRNPQTGDPIPISARRVLTFKPSQVLKGALNPHKEHARADRASSGDGGKPATAAVPAPAPPAQAGPRPADPHDEPSGVSG